MRLNEVAGLHYNFGVSYNAYIGEEEASLAYVGNDLRKMCEYMIETHQKMGESIRILTKHELIGDSIADSISYDGSVVAVGMVAEEREEDHVLFVVFTDPQMPGVIG